MHGSLVGCHFWALQRSHAEQARRRLNCTAQTCVAIFTLWYRPLDIMRGLAKLRAVLQAAERQSAIGSVAWLTLQRAAVIAIARNGLIEEVRGSCRHRSSKGAILQRDGIPSHSKTSAGRSRNSAAANMGGAAAAARYHRSAREVGQLWRSSSAAACSPVECLAAEFLCMLASEPFGLHVLAEMQPCGSKHARG